MEIEKTYCFFDKDYKGGWVNKDPKRRIRKMRAVNDLRNRPQILLIHINEHLGQFMDNEFGESIAEWTTYIICQYWNVNMVELVFHFRQIDHYKGWLQETVSHKLRLQDIDCEEQLCLLFPRVLVPIMIGYVCFNPLIVY